MPSFYLNVYSLLRHSCSVNQHLEHSPDVCTLAMGACRLGIHPHAPRFKGGGGGEQVSIEKKKRGENVNSKN
jgi:hypothetical protein